MKKILSITLCILLFTLMIIPAFSASAAKENNFFCDDYFLFEIVNGSEIIIHYYLGTEEVVTVPAEINGLPVRSIEKRAFFGTEVKEVIVSEGITTLGEEAFYNCQSLESVTLPSTLESTGTAAFRFCQNLKTVEFEGTDSAPQLGDYLFYACNSLDEVNIPEEVTSIPEGMFAYCQSLDSTVLPQGTEKISDYAFYGSGLKSITLPEELYYIGNKAFADCATLDEINNLSDRCDVVSDNAFSGTPAENPYEETETMTIYFLNYQGWKDIKILYLGTEKPNTSPMRELDMSFFEQTIYGQDVYKAEIPVSASIAFHALDENGNYVNSGGTDIVTDNHIYHTYSENNSLASMMYDPNINPLDPDTIPVYFASTLGWTDIIVYYYQDKLTDGDVWSRGTPMTYFETNAFGQDIYKADIPHTTTVTFDGYYENEMVHSSCIAELIEGYNAFFVNNDDIFSLGLYKYSPDVNPLDPDAVAPTSANYNSGAKTTVQPVGASSSDETVVSTSDETVVSTSDEISGVITEEGILMEAPFPEVVRYEKGLLAPVGAKVNEDMDEKLRYVRDDGRGDADGDGKISIKDATTIQKYEVFLITLSRDELKNADANADFDVNIKDATIIQKLIACLISEFP